MYRGCVRMRTVLAGALPCLIALCCVWPFVLKAALDDGLDAQPSLVATQKDSRDRDYVFVSAFFDDRLDSARPSIRVLGYHRRPRARPLYCEVRLRTGESLCLTPAATVVPLDPSTMFNETVVEHFYVCRLAYWHRPVAVSLGFSPNCRGDGDERLALDVRYSSAAVGRVRSPSGFGVCLSDVISRRVLRSHSDVQTLVECIEMNVILGMDRMYIYVGDMNPEVMLTLRKYMRRRLVEIVDWSSEQAALTDRGVALSLNDCLYRHMDRHRYLVFSGVDQLVLPHRQMSWRALLADVAAAAHNSNAVGAYVFAAFRYYDETTDDRKSSRRSLRGSTTSYRLPRIVTHRVRDKVAGNATRDARFIVEPRRLISIAATRISRMLPGYVFTSVSPLLGSAHQFESRTKLNAKDLQTRVVVDSSHDKYVPRLLKVLHQRFYRK